MHTVHHRDKGRVENRTVSQAEVKSMDKEKSHTQKKTINIIFDNKKYSNYLAGPSSQVLVVGKSIPGYELMK